MSVSSRSVTVATTATALNADAADAEPGQAISVHVPAGGVTVYVGGSGVTTANGYPIAAGEHFAVQGTGGDDLFGIVAAATQAVRVLEVGV